MDTRRYAKRQVTWFRNQMPGWVWTSPDEGMATAETLMKTWEIACHTDRCPISRTLSSA